MNKGFLDTCLLVVSRDEEEQNTIEAWSISVGWNHELRIKVNDSIERVVRANEKTRVKGAISTEEVGPSRPIARPAHLASRPLHTRPFAEQSSSWQPSLHRR